jgi:antitoxin (DNA-binding transcriptional repressor) of toxin-antitoxin stability system
MIEEMRKVHMTEAEVTNNFAGVLERLAQGDEVIVEQDDRPVALITQPSSLGRKLSECLAIAEARGSTVTLDEGFGNDLEEIIQRHPEPLDGWN